MPYEEERMKQTTYQVVTSDDQNLREDTAFFEHESKRELTRGYRLKAGAVPTC